MESDEKETFDLSILSGDALVEIIRELYHNGPGILEENMPNCIKFEIKV